jgi:uncharacterized membrane protein
MSRTCPNCRAMIPYIRGVKVEPPKSSAAAWWRFARRRLYCRSCEAQLRAVSTRAGHAILLALAIVVLLSLFALATGLLSGGFVLCLDLAVCVVLVIFDVRWGHTFELEQTLAGRK